MACAVRGVTLGKEIHEVELESAGARRTVRTRWIADASGRAGLIRRQLGLTRTSTHRAQRLLVPRQGSRRHRRLEQRSGLEGAGAVG